MGSPELAIGRLVGSTAIPDNQLLAGSMDVTKYNNAPNGELTLAELSPQLNWERPICSTMISPTPATPLGPVHATKVMETGFIHREL